MEKKIFEMDRNEIIEQLISDGISSLLTEERYLMVNINKEDNSFIYKTTDGKVFRSPFFWENLENESHTWEESSFEQFNKDVREGFKEETLNQLRLNLLESNKNKRFHKRLESYLVRLESYRVRLELLNLVTNLDTDIFQDAVKRTKESLLKTHKNSL